MKSNIFPLASGTALFLLLLGIAFQTAQSDFYILFPLYTLCFLCYFIASKYFFENNFLQFFLAIAILSRIGMLFAFPFLSDDVYRFVWDGHLLLNGHNPFDHLPVYYIENNISVPEINEVLFLQLNSPEYFTIYPPVAQSVFAFAVWLSPESVYGSALIMKAFLFLMEMGTLVLLLKLLKHFKLPAGRALWYLLNPLIIIELCGNLHFEAAIVFFLLLAFYLLVKQKQMLSSLALSLSIASKLLPLMFLPLLIKRIGFGKSIVYFACTGLIVFLLFIPLLSGAFFSNFGESLNLYFQKFEFNASTYYLLRWLGFQLSGYNQIAVLGPLLALGTLSGILWYAWEEKKPDWQNLPEAMLFAICLYLAFTTTVHPWYLSLPLVLCVFTRWRFPVLWSWLIFLSYINYSYSVYYENLWLVAVEYSSVLLFLGWEVKRSRDVALA